jgi:hypothetical protein
MEERTQTEVIIKTLALHFAVIASTGHLMSLQKQSNKRSKEMLWNIAWFIAVPTYPMALFFDRLVQCLIILLRKDRPSVNLSYCVGGLLGLHAEVRMAPNAEIHDTVPLFNVPLRNVKRVKEDRNAVWIGRYTVLLFLMAQTIATLVLSGRRFKEMEMCETDVRNASVAFGGLIVQLISASILLMNERWEYVHRPGEEFVVPHMAGLRQPSSAIVRIILTISILVNSWYFRFHIRDTYMIAFHGGLTSSYGRSYPLSKVTTELYSRDFYSQELYSRVYSSGSSDVARSLLPNLVWFVWPVMIYFVQREQELLALTVSALLAMSFSVEELVESGFSKWKDPLADALYVF